MFTLCRGLTPSSKSWAEEVGLEQRSKELGLAQLPRKKTNLDPLDEVRRRDRIA